MTLCIVLSQSYGCKTKSVEQRIRASIEEISNGVRRKDINLILKHISHNYLDESKRTFDDIKGLIMGYFLAYPKVSVYTFLKDIRKMNDDEVSCVIYAILFSGKKIERLKDIIPIATVYYRFDVVFVKSDNDLLIKSGKWKPILKEEVEEGIEHLH